MERIREDTIGGFNTVLADQRSEPGRAGDQPLLRRRLRRTGLRGSGRGGSPRTDPETYTPGGQTALHDTIATAVTETDR
jgi:hypothetical protein